MLDDQCLFPISISHHQIQLHAEGNLLSNGQVLYIMLGVRALPCRGRPFVLPSPRFWGGEATVGITKISTSLRAWS